MVQGPCDGLSMLGSMLRGGAPVCRSPCSRASALLWNLRLRSQMAERASTSPCAGTRSSVGKRCMRWRGESHIRMQEHERAA